MTRLTGKALAERRLELEAAEAKQPMSTYWLSFVDRDRPDGQRFLGVCIVRAQGVITATQRTWDLKINPGGEVACLKMPPKPAIEPKWFDRLLSAEDLHQAGLV